MLEMDQYEFIRTAHRVYGKNITELARQTGHSRNTIKKATRLMPIASCFNALFWPTMLNAGWRFAAAINSFVAGSPQRFGLLSSELAASFGLVPDSGRMRIAGFR